jgi:hypothetical protein
LKSDIEMVRRYDPGKEVNGCDGAFEPENRMPHGALRPGKTYEDRMPVEKRPRVLAAQKRAGR